MGRQQARLDFKFNSTRVYVQVLHLVLDTVVMIGRIWMKGQLTSVAHERWKEDPTESYLKAHKATSEPLQHLGAGNRQSISGQLLPACLETVKAKNSILKS